MKMNKIKVFNENRVSAEQVESKRRETVKGIEHKRSRTPAKRSKNQTSKKLKETEFRSEDQGLLDPRTERLRAPVSMHVGMYNMNVA